MKMVRVAAIGWRAVLPAAIRFVVLSSLNLDHKFEPVLYYRSPRATAGTPYHAPQRAAAYIPILLSSQASICADAAMSSLSAKHAPNGENSSSRGAQMACHAPVAAYRSHWWLLVHNCQHIDWKQAVT